MHASCTLQALGCALRLLAPARRALLQQWANTYSPRELLPCAVIARRLWLAAGSSAAAAAAAHGLAVEGAEEEGGACGIRPFKGVVSEPKAGSAQSLPVHCAALRCLRSRGAVEGAASGGELGEGVELYALLCGEDDELCYWVKELSL